MADRRLQSLQLPLLLVLVGTLTIPAMSSKQTADASDGKPNGAKAGDIGGPLVIASNRGTRDGYSRFLRSAELAGVQVDIPAAEDQDPATDQVSRLRTTLSAHAEVSPSRLVALLLRPASDVMLAGSGVAMAAGFAQQKARVVVSAQRRCPESARVVKEGHGGYRCLSSGALMGTVKSLLALLEDAEITLLAADTTEDKLQTAFVHLFRNQQKRDKYGLHLDSQADIFQCLAGTRDEVVVRFRGAEPFLQQQAFSTVPLLVYATDASSRRQLDSLGNYLAAGWGPKHGCVDCWRGMTELGNKPETFPRLLLAVFIDQPTPFLEEFLDSIRELIYPKTRIQLLLYNRAHFHSEQVERFSARWSGVYNSVTMVTEDVAPPEARARAVQMSVASDVDFALFLDSTAHLDNPYSLKLLIEQNREMVAPMLIQPYSHRANFDTVDQDQASGDDSARANQVPGPNPGTHSGADANGIGGPDRTQSGEYRMLIQGKKRGLWNVPHVSHCYMVKRKVLLEVGDDFLAMLSDGADRIDEDNNKSEKSDGKSDKNNNDKTNILNKNKKVTGGNGRRVSNIIIKSTSHIHRVFSRAIKNSGRFLYVSNRAEFGHLVDPTGFHQSPSTTQNLDQSQTELMRLSANQHDWERRYLHPNYSQSVDPQKKVETPCPDVFWAPLISERFAEDLIDIMERFGKWSSGNNEDGRLEGGYESVPTRDIHMKQVGLEKLWLTVLRKYVQPVQQRLFLGYESDPPQADLNFVVRYRPDEQPSLRPHHDSSTYTINVALNAPGEASYRGGGCRFIRQNCSVTDSRVGWMLLHPGRLTHYHEGLPTTQGTRYIMVSFIDP